MKTDLNYCIVLSSEQLAYLAGSKYGIDRMKILHRLIEAAVLEENDYAIKGFSTTLQVGQAILSEVDLSCKLGYDKKTISRVLDKMNQLGIVASTQSNRTSVHTLKCISAWMENGNRIDNPFMSESKTDKMRERILAHYPIKRCPSCQPLRWRKTSPTLMIAVKRKQRIRTVFLTLIFPLKANCLLYQTKGNYFHTLLLSLLFRLLHSLRERKNPTRIFRQEV